MIGSIGAWLARSVLMHSPIGAVIYAVGRGLKRFFGMLDTQGWIGLIAVIVLAIAWLHASSDARHYRKTSSRFEKLYNDELAHEQRIADQALDLKQRIDGLTAGISTILKGLNDAEAHRINDTAGALLLSGPGEAVCPGGAGAALAAGGHVAPAGPANVAVAPVPHPGGIELIALPFADTVNFARQCDLNRSEAGSWRAQQDQLLKIWPKQPSADPSQAKPK